MPDPSGMSWVPAGTLRAGSGLAGRLEEGPARVRPFPGRALSGGTRK